MTRWFVGVKDDGRREVFADSTGTDPTAKLRGYAEICGPYETEQLAAKAAKGKPGLSRKKRPSRRGS